MTTFGEKLKEIRDTSKNHAEIGVNFEKLFKRLALTESDFGVSNIWRWAEWPDRERLTGLTANDIGIDLVAVSITDELIAIQCKCYDDKHKLSKGELDTFFSFSGFKNKSSYELKNLFSMQWIVATCDFSKNASAWIDSQGKYFSRIQFNEYSNSEYTESDNLKRQIRLPFDFQKDAIDNCIQALYHNGFPRGRLIMACGTGKTFVSLKIAEKLTDLLGNKLVLFLAPSIALVSQARREWLRYTASVLKPLVVCSDGTAGGASEDISIAELKCKVTTDAKEISDFTQNMDENLRVIFCTYQSLRKVVDAQKKHGMPEIGLVVADEAHRTTGVMDKKLDSQVNFQLMHDGNALKAAKRMYMTATPRVYDHQSTKKVEDKGYRVADMGGENSDIYGVEMYRIGFGDAVSLNRLSEYRVIVLGVNEGSVTPKMFDRMQSIEWTGPAKSIRPKVQELVRVIGTSLAINGVYQMNDGEFKTEPLRKVLAYSNSIPRSKWYTAALELSEIKSATTRRMKKEHVEGTAQKMKSHHIDGTASSAERFIRLQELDNASKNGETYVVNNVKLFTEGVDVPSLDAVVFLDPRESQVDVVQAVGRVMRRAEGKNFGYIIVPVILANDGDWLTALEEGKEGYQTIGRVLRALQSHDSRLAEEPEKLVHVVDARGGGNGENGENGSDLGLSLSDSLKKVEQHIFAKVVQTSRLGKPGKLVADQIHYAVKHAASRFKNSDCVPDLAKKLDLTEDNDTSVSTIAALLLCNACLMHRRLKTTVPEMKMLTSLDKLSFSTNPIGELFNIWTTILEKDYVPIFAPAISILQALNEGGFTNEETHAAIRPLIECANQVADSLTDLGFDHAGPLYHGILPSASSDGAYYTNNLSALMLSRLALGDDLIDWSDLDSVFNLKVLDPACGTGTLLMAVCKTIKDRIKQHQKNGDTPPDSIELHKALVEKVVAGLDINHHAVQLAASNLTMGAPTVDYDHIHVVRMPHGSKHQKGHMQLGSLELLDMSRTDTELQGIGHDFSSIEEVGGETVQKDAKFSFPIEGLDLVIMNPPFTNNVKRGAKFDGTVLKEMRDREQELTSLVSSRDALAGAAIDSNSVATFFRTLADHLIDRDHGVLAEVLPTTALIGSVGVNERALRNDRFRIDCVVTSHDPNRPNFSENTNITESLMVSRRRTDVGDRQPKFINLRRMPKNTSEAIECSDAIASGDLGNWGEMTQWTHERLRNDDFRACLFVSYKLAEIASELASVEPAGQAVRGARQF